MPSPSASSAQSPTKSVEEKKEQTAAGRSETKKYRGPRCGHGLLWLSEIQPEPVEDHLGGPQLDASRCGGRGAATAPRPFSNLGEVFGKRPLKRPVWKKLSFSVKPPKDPKDPNCLHSAAKHGSLTKCSRGNHRQRQHEWRHLWRCPSRCTSLGV